MNWRGEEWYKYLRYNFTEDVESSIKVEDSGGFLNANLDGTLQTASKQNYFYLFVPRTVGVQGYNGSVLTENTDVVQIQCVQRYYLGSLKAQTDDDDVVITCDYYLDIYKVDITMNDSGEPKEGELSAYIQWSFGNIFQSQQSGTDNPYRGSKTVKFTVYQGVSQADTATGTDFYYMLDSDDTLKISAPYNEYTPMKSTPVSVSRVYNSNSSNQENLEGFKYIYIKSTGLQARNVTYSTDSSWATLTQVYAGDDRTRVRIYRLDVEANVTGQFRSSTIQILCNGSVLMNVAVTQYDSTDVVIDDPTSDYIEEDENKYWEYQGAPEVKTVDRNEGAIVDSSSLLFKSNQANIYTTIEQKDNTLFLGNYINNNSINNIPAIMETAVNDDNKIAVFDMARKITLELSTANEQYPYIPDMTASSQVKRIFKKGETYLLGLVFINNTGTWSTVQYLGDDKGKWSPLSNGSEITLHEEQNGTVYYDKPAKGCVLSEALTTELSSLGIVGVIPVYAQKTAHNIKCQGFMSPTMSSSSRISSETIDAQYSWFYRNFEKTGGLNKTLPTTPREDVEIQNLESSNPDIWTVNTQYCTINTPEVEVDESLTDSELTGSSFRCLNIYNDFVYTNNLLLQTTGKYIHSEFIPKVGDYSLLSITNRRITTGYFWKGFFNDKYNVDNGDLVTKSGESQYYKMFAVYPWQRNKIGGEGPESRIESKKLLNVLYSESITTLLDELTGTLDDLAIYRDFDTNSLLRVKGLYQGNVDYISVANSPYFAYVNEQSEHPYPRAYDSTTYAGYDAAGQIYDPINIKYKTAPHIVAKFTDSLSYTGNGLFRVELYDETDITKSDTHDLINYQWLKCGDIKRIIPGQKTTVYFEEGDYFFGRFDSLRTYAYSDNDPNSVIEVVSGMLCSRINLDSRCDRNRGGNTPTFSPANFNRFNPVYNQANNYFTFVYNDADDIVYNREYKNSIQWSLQKNYSSDIDDWCNIQDNNTLDLDGDKGQLEALVRLGNNLIAFQDTGIAQIQYNEKTQIATSEGVPIEIANSGKVDGKYYLYDNIGCQDQKTIAKSPSGVYFIDNINKSLFILGNNGLADLSVTGGMKSWALANIDDNWWTYYDVNTQEVLFTNEIEALAYSDSMKKFNAFLGYGNVRWNFRISDKMCQICTPQLRQVISTTTRYLSSSERLEDKYVIHDNVVNTFWKKNSIDATKFFGNYSPVEIQLHCNPEPTLDKTFSTVEYRTDCFDTKGTYLPDVSFDTFRAWNEYQDTLETAMWFDMQNKSYANYSRGSVYRLKKKFRIWRVDIPRAFYGNTLYLPGNTVEVPDVTRTVDTQTNISARGSFRSRDRIRNPWCNIYLAMDTSKTDKIVFHDLSIQYFK